MTAEQLKSHLDETPFRPFKIISADGHEIAVPHQDYVSLGPLGRTAVVWRQNDALNIVDIMLITRLEFSAPSS